MISAISAQQKLFPPSVTLSHQSVWVGAGHGIEVLVPSITDLPHWQWSVQHKMQASGLRISPQVIEF